MKCSFERIAKSQVGVGQVRRDEAVAHLSVACKRSAEQVLDAFALFSQFFQRDVDAFL